jgi:hypothetical protein
MKYRLLLCAISVLLILPVVAVAAASAQDGQANLIIINYVGREMTFTLDGTQYTVPGASAGQDGGRLSLNLPPGRHTYSAQVPDAEGTNGEVVLSAGQTQILGARLERTGPVVSSSGIVLEKPRDQLVIFEASLTPPAPTPEASPVPLQPLPPGQGALVFVNYIGEAVKVDINGKLYTVPADERLQINLPPGQVSFSANAGLSGTNGTAQVVAGEYTGLGLSREIGPKEPDYDVGKPVPSPVPLQMHVFPVPLQNVPVGQASPTPTREASPAEGKTPVPSTKEGELVVVNYIGQDLTFTIDNQAYHISLSGGQLTLSLVPGEYTFTASTPGASTNGALRVRAGQITHVSVALNVQSGNMEVYIE